MIKDLSELFQIDPAGFVAVVEAQVAAARPVSAIRSEALTKEARESYARARHLLNSPDLLSRLAMVIKALGYAGDPRPALIGFICLVSRLLETPLNIAYIAPSAAGKNAAAEATLPMFPEQAFYLIQASSPRALIYNEEGFEHRIVIVTEADSLPEEGPAASAVRSLMSDPEMSYEVVEKGDDGKFHTRIIKKPGPTGLITTSTKPLGEQANTRLLTITMKQTRLELLAQAKRAEGIEETPDLEEWLALQRWLELAGQTRVVIPYASQLAELVPANTVRMRRDFPQLLTVIKTIALLYQQQRERD